MRKRGEISGDDREERGLAVGRRAAKNVSRTLFEARMKLQLRARGNTRPTDRPRERTSELLNSTTITVTRENFVSGPGSRGTTALPVRR